MTTKLAGIFRNAARNAKVKIEEDAYGRSNLKGAPRKKKPNAMNHPYKGDGNAMAAGR